MIYVCGVTAHLYIKNKKGWYTTMSKIAVVYWSGTGNTEAMASAVADGIKEAGAEVLVMPSAEFDASQMDSYDAIAACKAPGKAFV